MENNNTQRKVNILYIIDTLCGEGGTENHLYYLAKYLDKSRFRCSIVSFNIMGPFVDKIRDAGIKVYHVPVARYYTPEAFIKSFYLRKIIKDNNIDIVQTFHYKSDTYGVINAKLAGIEHIISSRRDVGDTKKRFHFLMNRICNRFIDRYITVCKAVGDRISSDENIARIKQKNIYNGVALENYHVPDKDVIRHERKKLGLAEDDFVLGMVANFRPEKNHEVFFRALKMVKTKIKKLKVITVGAGPTEDYCRNYCRDNGMDDDVIFAGRVKDVRNHVGIMDVACLVPGSNEGFSNAVLEKMAMGKPLIVTLVGGNAEAVSDGENGIVIPPFDPERLAEAILFLYENPGIREKMGRKSRERVEKLFAMEKMIKAHEDFYGKIYREEYVEGTAADNGNKVNALSIYKTKAAAEMKSFFYVVLSIGLYYTGVIALFNYLKKDRSNGVKILAYHDISDKSFLNLHLPVDVFRKHISYLKRKNYNIISLADAVGILANNRPIGENTVVITFDDVYRNFYTNVFPIIKEYQTPVTIFISTGPLEKRYPLFIDALIYAFENTLRRKLDLTEWNLNVYRINSPTLGEYAIDEINEFSKNLSTERKKDFLEYIFKQLDVDLNAQELRDNIISWDEVREMNRYDIVEFGAHTDAHPSLSRIPEAEAEYEIVRSKEVIQEKLKENMRAFSYPFGSINDINDEVREIVKKNGFSCACTLSMGINKAGEDLFLLKRMCISNHIKSDRMRLFSDAVFAIQMSGIITYTKNLIFQ